MLEHLYRFRSAEALLGKFAELEKQEIYFASREELNDPLEGFKNIFWQGDSIVWKNFLKHYLLCVLHISAFFITDGEYEIKDDDIPIRMVIKNLPPRYQNQYQEICDQFFKNERIQKYPEWLASRNSPIRRNELLFYLKILHYYALKCIFSRHGLLSKYPEYAFLNKAEEMLLDFEYFDKVNRLVVQYPNVENIEGIIYGVQKNIHDQIYLTAIYNNPYFHKNHNGKFIFLEFPEKYLKNLEKIIHPEWYTACFQTNYQNPSMWSYYGHNHKGICLKFKTTLSSQGTPTIKLQRIVGFDSRMQPRLSYQDTSIFEIKYNDRYPEIDFFRSLGRLPIPVLYDQWYMDENKNKSSCADIFNNEGQWRKKYWDDFLNTVTVKLEGWSHEKEHRLILYGLAIDFSNKENRKLKYNFSDLEGIIFGIETSMEDKIEIIKIIEEKCKKEGRNNFKFYQANYSTRTGKIELFEMNIKFR